jgi:hypothetical protein
VRLVSFIILVFLLLQASTGLLPRVLLVFNPSSLLWPFLNYTMYSAAHYERDHINQYSLVGISSDFKEIIILPADLDLKFWLFQDLISFIRDGKDQKVKYYIDYYQRKHEKKLIGLRLENYPLILSQGGVRLGERQILKHLWLEGSREEY